MRWPSNPTLLRCSACGAQMKWRLEGRWWWVALLVWFAGASLIVPADMPFGWQVLLVFALAWPWQIAENRVYYAWWTWRHPARCDGAGHTEPEGRHA